MATQVTIVGAGPTGLHLASKLSDFGISSLVLEEHAEVGVPVHCSGLISESGCHDLDLKLDGVLLNEIYGADIISPEGTKITVERKRPVAYVVDRELFDKNLYKKAISKNVQVDFNSKLINFTDKNVFYQKENHGTMVKSKIVVGADGVQSRTRELMNLNAPTHMFVHAYQQMVSGDFDPKKVNVYLCREAVGFFAWLIPHSKKEADLGIGVTLGNNPKSAFDSFYASKNFDFEKISETSSIIPVGHPLKHVVLGNQLLVGDAAFQTKATTGGGIIFGLRAAETAANAISDTILNSRPLENYEKMLSGLNKELVMHWKIRSYINSLGTEKTEKLFLKAKRAGFGEFLTSYGDMDNPTKFIGKIFRKPSMLTLFPEAMKFIFS